MTVHAGPPDVGGLFAFGNLRYTQLGITAGVQEEWRAAIRHGCAFEPTGYEVHIQGHRVSDGVWVDIGGDTGNDYFESGGGTWSTHDQTVPWWTPSSVASGSHLSRLGAIAPGLIHFQLVRKDFFTEAHDAYRIEYLCDPGSGYAIQASSTDTTGLLSGGDPPDPADYFVGCGPPGGWQFNIGF